MNNPIVSVIMPSLNVAPYIRECMESVVNQTLKKIEIICVDAGSTDGTLEVLEEYAARDQRITIIHSDKKSYGYQMNIGIAAAIGKYIGIVETDDYILPQMYEELCGIADESNVEVLRADCYRFTGNVDSRSRMYQKMACRDDLYDVVIDPKMTLDVFKGNSQSQTGIYRTSFLREKHIRYRETPGASFQDIGFKLQTISKATRYMFCRRGFYMYRYDNPNSSVKNKKKVFATAEEHDWCRERLHDSPFEKHFAKGYALARFQSYEFTLTRIAPEFRLEFLQRYAEDFRKIDTAGELDKSLYTRGQWEKIHEIMECPEYIYYRDYYKDGQIKAESARQRKTAAQLQHELDCLHNSVSYRIGRGMTWLPRKVRGGVQCYRDHGASHTFRRTLYHMGLWEDEANPDYNNRPLLQRFADCCSDHGLPHTAWRVLVYLHMAKDTEEPALLQRLEAAASAKKEPEKPQRR